MLKGAYIDLLLYLFDSRNPIKDYEHVGRILGIDKRLARSIWGKLEHKFYQTSIQTSIQKSTHKSIYKSGGFAHKLVTEILNNRGRIKELRESASPQYTPLDPDPDPDPEVTDSSDLLSSEVKPPLESKPKGGGVEGVKAPATPAPLGGLNQAAWEDYQQHRCDIRVKPLKPKSIQRLQRWLVKQGNATVQAAIIDQTIRNGWTGLFELKNATAKSGVRTGNVSAEEFERWLNEDDGETYEGEFREIH